MATTSMTTTTPSTATTSRQQWRQQQFDTTQFNSIIQSTTHWWWHRVIVSAPQLNIVLAEASSAQGARCHRGSGATSIATITTSIVAGLSSRQLIQRYDSSLIRICWLFSLFTMIVYFVVTLIIHYEYFPFLLTYLCSTLLKGIVRSEGGCRGFPNTRMYYT